MQALTTLPTMWTWRLCGQGRSWDRQCSQTVTEGRGVVHLAWKGKGGGTLCMRALSASVCLQGGAVLTGKIWVASRRLSVREGKWAAVLVHVFMGCFESLRIVCVQGRLGYKTRRRSINLQRMSRVSNGGARWGIRAVGVNASVQARRARDDMHVPTQKSA